MTERTQNLRINADRLWDDIMRTARIGGTPKGGINRLTLTDADREVRDWFVAACKALGCRIEIDEMGNIFASRPGKNPNLAPIAMGSHLDTQPTGGKFDGVAGVLCGLEVLRTLHEANIETNAPIEVIDWTNEEGSRFPPPMLSSGVYAGKFTRDWAYAREDREGKRFGDELERIGYKGSLPCGAHKLAAHFEVHIEQGPILEAEGKTIGVVTGVQGMRWYEVTVRGTESHSGSTAMTLRRDALLGAARMVEAVNATGLRHAPNAVATVGFMEVKPNSRNVIPGHVFFSIDFRHPSDAVLDAMEAEIGRAIQEIATASNVEAEMQRIWKSPPVHFDPACIEAVRSSAAELGYSYREIISGPGHDSAYVASVAPTAMIFLPCEKGISHNEAENVKKEDLTAAANVLLHAVLKTDARLAGQTQA
jgi:N-carbamoyl-L-amino-acid hydrolase